MQISVDLKKKILTWKYNSFLIADPESYQYLTFLLELKALLFSGSSEYGNARRRCWQQDIILLLRPLQ